MNIITNSPILLSEKSILKSIYFISAIVFLVVVLLYQLPQREEVPLWAQALPKLNASINGVCSILLILSFISIRKKNVEVHKKLNIIAFVLSSLFLISYITYHSFGVETKFPVNNPMRPLYIAILISHIILAALVFPLILFTFYRGLNGQVQKHKKLARLAMPVWLYVTVSGVLVYLLISPYYDYT